MASDFKGTTGDATRDKVQQTLAQNIGNESTRSRSIELAIRTEAALFERCGTYVNSTYKTKYKDLVKLLKDSDAGRGFELNRRLLCGELAPEKWMEEQVPEQLPQRAVAAKKPEAPAVNTAPAPAAAAAASSSSAAEVAAPKTDKTSSASATPMDVDSPVVAGNDDKKEKSKREASSYYFFGSTPAEQAKQYAPKPLDAETVQQVQPVVASGVSKWNAGGTWEERDLSSWAQEHMKRLLSAIQVPEFADGTSSISSWTVTGEASILFVRGKKRAGWELQLKTTYQGEYKGTSVEGSIEIPSMESTDGDDVRIEFTSKKSGEPDAVVRLATKKAEPQIKSAIVQFIKDIKAKESE